MRQQMTRHSDPGHAGAGEVARTIDEPLGAALQRPPTASSAAPSGHGEGPAPANRCGAFLCAAPRRGEPRQRALARSDHLMILVTRPEPTVRPPSRMAKPRPSSMAIGWMSSTVISVLSPGMTISVPSGSVMTPVTSVVRK